jgi:outer membrane protein assembly factor BamC
MPKSHLKHILSTRLTTPPLLLCTIAISGCSALQSLSDDVGNSSKVNYRQQATKIQPLDVPPDLAQLSRDGRVAVATSGGSISATQYSLSTGTALASNTAGAKSAAPIAPQQLGQVQLKRDGIYRWLSTTESAEVVFPKIIAFWADQGFAVESQNPATGIIETNWNENRAKIPQDFVRNTLGKVFDGLWSSGERDKFRTRLESTEQGTEITITHKGMQEVFTSNNRDSTRWSGRPREPELEAEFLSRLLVALGGPQSASDNRTSDKPSLNAANNGTLRKTEAAPSSIKARAIQNNTQIELAENFDRAWRRIGTILDRSGFTIEDRDRSAGIYFIRYSHTPSDEKANGLFSRMKNIFTSNTQSNSVVSYRLSVQTQNSRSIVQVLGTDNASDTSEPARQIIQLLLEELQR